MATGVIDLGNANDIKVLWVVQEIASGITTLNNVITGVAWNWGSGNNGKLQDFHPGHDDAGADIIWTHGEAGGLNTNANSLNFQIPGNSAKCGSWNPFSTGTTTYKAAIGITNNITNSGSFYDKSDWNIGTSGGWDACSLAEVDANVTNGYLTTNFNTSKVYNRTCSGWESSTNGGAFVAEAGITGDWPTNADVSNSEVRIECNHALTATNYKNYECFKLVIGNGPVKVTLTVDPGNNLLFSQALSFIPSSNNARPLLLLRSGPVVAQGPVMYSTVLPSSAPFNDLDGDLSYELYIKHAGWHHLQSPILSKLQDIAVRTTLGGTPVDLSGTSFFTSTSAAQYTTSRVWSWDGVAQQWINQAANTATADFNSQPYTIFVHPDEIPLTFTVTGLIPSNFRDQTNLVNLTSSSTTSSVGFGNVPWVRTGTTV